MKKIVISFILSGFFVFPLAAKEISYQELNQTYDVLSDKVVTPHIKWANPYYLGKIKALVIAPTWTQRETIELAQRLSLDYIPLMAYSLDALTGYWYLDVPSKRVENDLKKRLRKNLDLIIIGGVEWEAFPQDFQEKILNKVSKGTGLVYTLISQKSLKLLKSKITPTKEGREIFNGIPSQFLPLLKEKGISESIQTYNYQKGRVVLLNYGRPSLHQSRNQSLTPPGLYEEKNCFYEYFMSILAKASLWASKKEPEIIFTSLPVVLSGRKQLTEKKISVNLLNKLESKKYNFKISIRDKKGLKEYNKEDEFYLAKGESKYSFSLPVLKLGDHFIDLWIKEKDKIINWATVPLKVTGSLSITKLELNKESYREGELLTGGVLLSQKIGNENLEVELWDNYHRLLVKKRLTTKDKKANFSFLLPEPLSILHTVKVFLKDKQGTIDKKEREFPVLKRKKEKDYFFTGWGYVLNSYPSILALRALANNGFDTLYEASHTTNRVKVKLAARENLNLALFGWWVCPGRTAEQVKIIDGYPVCTDPLTSKSYLDGYRKILKSRTELFSPYCQPFIYSLGDECCLELDHKDIDFSSSCLEDFRKWAKKKYKTIEKANKVWKTSFKDFSEARPLLLKEAKKIDNYSRWIDHRLHMEEVFANTLKIGRDAVKSINPEAKVGFEGAITLSYPPSFVGYNWYKIMQVCDFIGVYKGVDRDFVYSFKQPGTIVASWTGSYIGMTKEEIKISPWTTLFYGGDSIWWWLTWHTCGNGGLGALAPDLTPLPWLLDINKEVSKIKSGIGKLLLYSKAVDDPIAIHYSNLCIHASTIDSSIGNWVDSIRCFSSILKDIGFQYRFLATEQIEKGKLNNGDFKVLILPYSQILTLKEIAEIKKFVSNGGLLIADLSPGVRDEYGYPLKESSLSFLFSSTTTPNKKSYGKGEAILIGSLLRNYLGEKQLKLTPEAILTDKQEKKACDWERNLFLKLLAKAGLKPRLSIKDKNGKIIPDIEVRYFKNGEVDLFGVLPSSRKVKAILSFPHSGYIYELREGKNYGLTKDIETEIIHGEAKLYAVLPRKINSLTIEGNKEIFKPGEKVELMLTLQPSDFQDVVHIEVIAPGNKKLSFLTQNQLIIGKKKFFIPLSLNQKQGVYRIKAKEVISNATAEFKFEVKR